MFLASLATVFELELLRFDPELYKWQWNKNGNLEGATQGKKVFTWQPHGSQFTVIEQVPETKLCLKLKKPSPPNVARMLEFVGFEESWVEVVKGE